MADKKITELTNITGANLVDADEFVVVDISADETKAITLGELKEAFDSGSGFVRITGDTMTGPLDVQSTITSDGLILDQTTNSISTGTSDGADNARTFLNGGGSPSVNRGGNISVYGNEYTTSGGSVVIAAGDALTGGAVDGRVRILTGPSRSRINVDENGDISFYEDTGTTPKFFWDASAESLRLGTYNGGGTPSGSLFVDSNANNHAIHIEETGGGSESWQIGVDTDGDLGFYNSTSTTASVTFDDSGNVGIGTTSLSTNSIIKELHIDSPYTNGVSRLRLSSSVENMEAMVGLTGYLGEDALYFAIGSSGDGSATERMRIDSSGNVGIGTSSPDQILHVEKSVAGGGVELLVGNSGANQSGTYSQIGLGTGGDSTGTAYFRLYRDGSGISELNGYTTQTFLTNGSERMRITSAGDVGIGTSSPSASIHAYHATANVVGTFESGDADVYITLADNTTTSDTAMRIGVTGNDMHFSTSAQERLIIDSSGNVGIGTSSPAQKLHVNVGGTSSAIKYLQIDGAGGSGSVAGQMGIGFRPIAAGSNVHASIEALENSNGSWKTNLLFKTNGVESDSAPIEAMRIDSSGNLLVGVTSPQDPLSTTTNGHTLYGNGVDVAIHSRNNANPLAVQRTGNDGEVINVFKDTAKVGSIAAGSGDLIVGNGNVGLRFNDSITTLVPRTTSDGSADGTINIGAPSARFKDLYLSGVAKADTFQFAQNSVAAGATEAIYRPTTGQIAFKANSSERMRIDSSGNLLVGTTDASVYNNSANSTADNGLVYEPAGSLSVARSAGVVQYFNRTTSDGDIVQFRKSGTAVGSIGHNGNIYLAGTSSGIRVRANDVIPATAAGAANDNALDLGISTARFKDLYLSGGVYLGGTGSANKLDDYEEGTFSPVIRDASSGGNTASSYLVATGRYTKVGRMVHATINFVNIDTTGMTSGNAVYVTGLPFTSVNSFGYPAVPVNASAVASTNGYVRGSVFYNASYLSLSEGTTTGGASLTVSDLTSGDADIYINFSYEAA